MRAYERLINYVKVHTASIEDLSRTPSTERQFDLSRLLSEEMKALGLEDVYVDEHAYTYGFLPAAPGCGDWPCIGFNAIWTRSPIFRARTSGRRCIKTMTAAM